MASEVVVQYPVNIKTIVVPSHIGEGEKRRVSIEIENISTLPKLSEVELRVHLGNKLVPVDPHVLFNNDHTYYGNSKTLSFPVPVLDALSTFTVNLNLALHPSCKLFSLYDIKFELFYKGKKIEFYTKKIRHSPIFTPQLKVPVGMPSSKALLITSQHLKRQDFVCLSILFDMLHLPFDMWDVERYHGISGDESLSGERHSFGWLDKYPNSIIFFLHADKFHSLLTIEDIVKHMQGVTPSNKGVNLRPNGRNSSSIVFCGLSTTESDKLAESLFECGVELTFGGSHLQDTHLIHKPERKDLFKQANKQVEHLHKEDPFFNYKPFSATEKFEKVGGHYWYGVLKVKKSPLPRTASLVSITDPNSSSVASEEYSVGFLKFLFLIDYNVPKKSPQSWFTPHLDSNVLDSQVVHVQDALRFSEHFALEDLDARSLPVIQSNHVAFSIPTSQTIGTGTPLFYVLCGLLSGMSISSRVSLFDSSFQINTWKVSSSENDSTNFLSLVNSSILAELVREYQRL